MRFYQLSALFGDAAFQLPTEQVQASVFLLQQVMVLDVDYSFALHRGHVRSEELGADLALLALSKESRAGQLEPVTSPGTAELSTAFEQYRSRMEQLLRINPDVIEAAATQMFYNTENLGNPTERLRWFSSLPDPIREEASTLVSGLERAEAA